MLIASPSNTSSLCKGRRYYLLIAVSIVVVALLALPLFIGSASTPTTLINQVAVKDKFDISTVTPHQNLRSEEHTSELQSQSNLVCRLLLEKKKKKNKNQYT